MKIEIGESIILSWLKHSKNCQIVQTNWKPSMVAWEFHNDILIEEIITKCQTRYLDKGYDLFRKNSSISQIIQQGEIDALGMEIADASVAELYAVDVAFHEAGLNYGSKDTTVAKVLMKLVRMSCTLLGFFENKKAEIIFATPKVNNATLVLLEKEVVDLNAFLKSQWELDFNIRLICNEDFNNKIFKVITTLSKDVADTSELFMRSVQMYNMFNEQKQKNAMTSKPKVRSKYVLVDHNDLGGFGEIKIGALVRSTLPDIVSRNMLDENLVLNLCSHEFCKSNFDLNYALLKKVDERVSVIENRYENGYPRYYANPITVMDERYLITSEWFDRNKPFYISWLTGIGYKE